MTQTAVLDVDLTGSPSGVWLSPDTCRFGQTCGNSHPSLCIEFLVTLDPGAEGINFQVASGAMPGGALFYQINCGPPVSVGVPLCVSGTGPHRITFCKPGKNKNTYRITSIAKPSVDASVVVSDGCTSTITAAGYQAATVTWQSVSPGVPGQYNNFLSCTSGCLSTVATYEIGAPASVTYEVCGVPTGGCSGATICKTTTVHFVSTLDVTISPLNPTICFGGASTQLTANPTGGAAPYTYTWSNGSSTQVIDAFAPGVYKVALTDTTSCPAAEDSVTVTAYSRPILAMAGPDKASCANNPTIVLDGAVQEATGGIWTGGAGTYAPSNTSLTPTYTPTAGEILAGTVTHRLTTTGNGTCPAHFDEVIQTIALTPIVDAGTPHFVCGNNASVSLNGTVSNAGGGRWSGGSGTYFPNDSTLTAIYTPSPAEILAGTVTLTLTSIQNGTCIPVTDDVTISITPAPTVNANIDQAVCANNADVVLSGVVGNNPDAFSWSGGAGAFSPNNTTLNATYTPTATEITNGTVTLRLTATKNLCSPVFDEMTVTIDLAPTVNAGPDRTVCANNGNVTLNGTVTIATGGLWESSGTGSFNPDATTLNATYVPSAADTLAGSVTLTLTSTGNGLCNEVTDLMTITYTDAPTVSANTDQTVCGNNPNVTLNGSFSAPATGITWSGGTGIFSPNANTRNAIYTPSAGEITAGTATLTISTTGAGLCSVVTDQMIITITDAPTANANIDQTVCGNNRNVSLNGIITVATGGQWTTSGTGSFNPDATTLNATYVPSNADTTAGTVTLTLTTTGNGLCNAVSDPMIITITDAPFVNAGPDQTICANNTTLTLNGSVRVATGGTWTGGLGTFTPDANTLNATYVPTQTEINNGFVNLTLTTTGNGTCSAVSDQMRITVTPPPTADAGGDHTPCANNPNVTLAGAVTIATGGIWSGGTGTFSPNNTTLNATYTPSATEIAVTVAQLVLTTTGNGNCTPVTDTVQINILPAPIVNAGPDRTVCANNPTATLAGSVIAAGGFSWSGGAGTFTPNSNTLNATYTPTATEISNGTVILTLTGTRGGCNSVMDQMTITITPAPTVNAGPDQTVCGNNATALLNGAITTATGGLWTSSGSGSFNPDVTTLNASYIPSAADTTAGNVTLTLETTGNDNCLAVDDDMIITITDVPVVNAGSDQTVCGNRATVTLNGSVFVSTGGVWTTSGSGTFNPNTTTLNATYSPSVADTAAGSVTLTLTSTGNGNCTPVADQLVITITDAPIVNAGSDISICANNPVANLNGAITVATGAIWTGGSGIYNPNNTTLNATYTPTATEISNGSVLLTLTSTGNGSCNQVADQVLITITPAPTVTAGPDQGVCGNTASVPLSGAITVAAGGTWTTTGTGSFNPNTNTLNASYVPSAADIAATTVTLRLTTTGNGTCIAVDDEMVITFSAVPFADAGPDQTVCTNDFPAQLNGAGTTSSWIGGAGTFTPNRNVLNPTYIPTAGEITTGSVTLTLQTTPIGACPSVSDDIILTLPLGPVVDAGSDEIVCGDVNTIPLTGSVLNAGGGQWTTSGTGSFNPDATTLNASYVPSADDKTNGGATLVLTSTGNGSCSAESDTMLLTITPAPTVNAGLDQTVCANNANISLNGSITVATGAEWTTDGTGSFNPDITTLNAAYIPSAADTTAGTVTLTLTTTGNGTCIPVEDEIIITINPAPVVDAGPDQTICADRISTALSGLVTVATGGIWTTSGTGSFSPNDVTLNTSYFPSDADTAAGSVRLVLSSTGNGICLAETDTMFITIDPAPVVNAGPDQTLCADITLISLDGGVTNAGGGTWTSSGTGSFAPDNTTLNASYDPSTADSLGNVVTLTLTSTVNGLCNAVSDQTIITLTPAPTIDAGPDRIVCGDAPSLSVTANVTVAAGVLWTSSGTGTFTNPNDLTTTYNGTNADTTTGSVILRVVSTGNGTCNPVRDSLTVTIADRPIVNAGPDQTVCGDISGVSLNGAILHATGGDWSGGNGTFSPNVSTLNATYNPTAAERVGTSITLTLTSTGNGTCNPVTDDVEITITPIPTVNAGPDQTVCADIGDVDLNGTVTIATGGTWTTSGTGSFADANSLITTYTPSATDITNGLVTLTLTSTGNGTCNPVTNQMIITITPAPTVDAGPDRTICADQLSIVLNGSVTTATGGNWSTLGSGSFAPGSTALNGNYFTSLADTTAGTVRLVLTTTGNGTCNAVTDTMELTINPAPIVNAGSDVIICADVASIPLTAGVTNAAGGEWTSTGTGTFNPNAFTINATYVPSAFDKAAGNVTLTLTSTGNGLCNAVTDQMTITITPAPTINAGSDQTVCATTTGVQLNGSVTVATGGTWSTSSGQGTFNPDPNTLNAVFIPSALQIASGLAILRLTSTGNGTCLAVSDEMRITINPAPVVDAGPSQTVCASITDVNLTGTISNATGGTWTTSGTGTFADANAFITTYTPSAFDKTAGNITLTLSSTGNGVCSPVSDIVAIGFQGIPTVDAGPSTACATMAGIQLNGAVTNASGGRWTSTGSGTFVASQNILNPRYNPSVADETAGSVVLYLTATGTGPCAAPIDSIMLGVQPNPVANAGPDQIVCADIGNINLNGSIANAGGGVWSSSGGGPFSPDSITLNASYTLSAVDVINGTVTLTLTTTGNGFCNAVSDAMVVTITPAPTVEAGPNQTICADASGVALNGSVTVATGGTWTSSGTGSFNPDPTTLNAIYVPSDADTTAGSVRLTLTTTGNGTCNAVSDSMDITITPAPTVQAGFNTVICADVDQYAFSATTTVATGVTWTRIGSGTFDDPNATTTIYTISDDDKANGFFRVIATTTGNGTCSAVSDTVTIVITPAPTVVATSGNACADVDTLQLGGVVTVATGGMWTTTGTGTFVPDNVTLNARYAFSAADKTPGSTITFVLTTTGNGDCGEVTDTINVNIVPSPEADAGADQTVCANVTVPLNGIITNAGGGIWSTLGTGSFNPDATTLNATYVPSTADTSAGAVTLVLTTTGNGFCNAVTDTMDITFTPAPIVEAGPAIICVTAGSVNLDGFMANAGGVQWTSTGDGIFGDEFALSTTYTLGANDILNGTATLTLSTTGNGICAAALDNIILNIANAPTADAGAPQNICGDAATISLSGNFTNAGSTEWSTPDGTGTFDDFEALNTNYNVTDADTTRGFVTFVLTTIDNGICLPVTDTMVATITDAPTIDAGPANVCSNAPPVSLSGSMTVATGAIWTTAGDGTFSDPTILNPTYTPGVLDNGSGSVVLRLTTNAGLGTCNPVFDEITLNITDAPQALANVDQTICADAPGAILNGSVIGALGGIWSSSGSGSFDDPTTLNANYVPSDADTTAGSVTLMLTTTGVGSCNPVTDTMILAINPVPIVNAGNDQTVCGDIVAVNLNGAVLHATGGTWTTTDGTGIIATPSNLNTSYAPTAADTTRGSVTFVLTSTGMGSCLAVTDTMVVTITDAPSVDAGPVFLCSDAISIPLTGTKTVASGVNWTTDGDGVFSPNNLSLNTNYVASANDRADGTVILTITTTGNGTCIPVTDNITIYLRPAPTVDAGGDQGICADAGVVTLTGSVTDAGGGLWTTLGSGNFAPDNALNTIYNLSNADTAAHVVRLVLTTTGTAPCTPVSDTVQIDITPAPVALVNAGNDTTVCETDPNVPLTGTIANAAGGMWTTDGSGIFTPNAFTLNATYMPSGGDVTDGTVVLVLESTGNGICNPVRDTMIVTITPRPTADAGVNDTVCADVAGIPLNGLITTATIGLWNTSGSGSFNPDANTLNATYVPSLADTADGTVVLTLQTIDNGACSAAFDNKTITITPAPTVNAGFDQAVCGDADSINISGLITVATGGTWTTNSVDGTFTDANSLNTYYHLTPTDTAAGSITLTLTTTGNGTCNAVDDELVLTITDAPLIDAGPDQTICADNPTVVLAGSITVASGAEWSSTGTGFYAPNQVSLNASYFGTDADTTTGTLTFVLTSTGNGTCNTVTDTMEVIIDPAPIINAGPDMTICADVVNTTLNGSVVNAGGGSWVSSGTGTFADANILNAVYDPSNADTTNKIVIMTLTTTGVGFCDPISDQMRLTITPTPIVRAGPDQTVCADVDTIAINGSVINAGGGVWSTTTGTGIFSSDSSLTTFYIPSNGDKTSGSIYLKLTSIGNGSCIPVADSLLLTITPAPVVSAGGDFPVCADKNTVDITGSITVATGGIWQTSGTGTFTPNSTSMNTVTYVPSAADKAFGLVGITLTSTGNGTCQPVTDDMILTITPAPTVNAGVDQTICADAASVQLSGSRTVATGVSWTSSGTGGFSPNNTSTNSLYVPSAADRSAGVVNLTITTTGNGTCSAVTDQMRITITPAPTVNASIDQTICADAGTITLSGSATVATGGTWSTNGTGAFNPDPNGLSRTYTISAGDTTAGSIRFVLTTTGNGLCQAVRDTMMVTINPVPIISTGSATICSDVTGVDLDGSVVNATGAIWTTSGTGAFAPNAATLNARYTPSQADVTAGFVVLRLTSDGHGTCNPVFADMNVTITPLPVANAGVDQRICRFDSTVIIGQSFPNVTYNWFTTTGVNISTSGIAFVRADSDTSFVLRATDTKGCSVNDTMTIFVVDPPTFNLLPNYCYAFGTPLDANPVPVPVNGNFQWFRNDSLQLGENNSSIMIEVVGEHVISYNYGSCTVFDTTVITPLPVLNGLDKFACTSASTIVSTTNIPGASYSWTENGNPLAINDDSITVITSGTPWDSIQYIAVVTDVLGCINNDTIYSVAVPPPVLTLTNQPSCVGDLVTLNAEPSNIPEIAYGQYSTYGWQVNTNSLPDTSSSIQVNTTGSYSVIYNIGECFAYDTSTVTFYPVPVPNNGEKVIYCNESDLTAILDAGPAERYYWSNTPNTPNDTLRAVEIDDPGMYYVDIYNEFNCFVTDSVYAEDACPPRIFIPQAFIPNDPNPKNRTFIVQGAYFTNFKLTIYNRWGEVIYYSEDPLNGWDGFYRDEEMPIGVYPYVVTYDGAHDLYKGPYRVEGAVMLVR